MLQITLPERFSCLLLLLVLVRGSVTIYGNSFDFAGSFPAKKPLSYPTTDGFCLPAVCFTITGSIHTLGLCGSGLGVLLIPFVMTYLFDKLGIRCTNCFIYCQPGWLMNWWLCCFSL
jgi:hypothetical protein